MIEVGRAPTGVQIALWLMLVALVTALSLRGWGTFQVGAYQDDAQYVVLARSIAFGDTYGLVSRPPPTPPSKFPFGFPLVLAPVVRFFPDELVAATAVSLAATLLNVSLLFWGWQSLSPTTSRWYGLATASLYGLSPVVIGQTRMVMSEPVFTSFVSAALILVERCVRSPRRWAVSLLLGVLLALALFTRSIGAAFCAAVLLRLAVSGRAGLRPLAGAALGGIALVATALGLTVIDLRQMQPSEYTDELLDPLRQSGELTGRESVRPSQHWLSTVADYFDERVRKVLIPAGDGERGRAFVERWGLRILYDWSGPAVAAVVTLGFLQAARSGALTPSVILFELLYGAALAVWPWTSSRLLYPLLPFLFFQLLFGAQLLAGGALALLRRDGGRFASAIAASLWLVLAAIGAWKSTSIDDSRFFASDLSEGPRWFKANAAPNVTIMTRYPEIAYLYAGRTALPLPPEDASPRLRGMLEQQHVDYIVLEPALEWSQDGSHVYTASTRRTWVPVCEKMASRGELTRVYGSSADNTVRIYRVER